MTVSRAFVKEDDPESASARDDAEHRAKRDEWLRIQQKKLDALRSDESARKIDPARRERWIREIEEEIRRASDI